MITIDGVQFRNLEEQVKKNMDDIKYILEEAGVLNKSEQEITDKTFETIEAAKNMIDVEAVKAAMNLATKKENRFNNAD